MGAKQYYDRLSEKYDQATKNAWASPAYVEAVTQQINVNGKSILDIGIGTGQSVEKLYAEKKFAYLEGIDISARMLAFCREKYPDIVLHQADFMDFNGFQKPVYDLIICCGALEFILDLGSFLSKCKNLLAKNGQIVLTYEPQIHGHFVQHEPISISRSEALPELTTYRHDPDFFHMQVLKLGLKIMKENLFVAYKKNNTDIIYSLLQLQM